MVETHPQSILLDIPSGPEAVFNFMEFKSWYTSALKQDTSDSIGTAGEVGMDDGRFELYEFMQLFLRFHCVCMNVNNNQHLSCC